MNEKLACGHPIQCLIKPSETDFIGDRNDPDRVVTMFTPFCGWCHDVKAAQDQWQEKGRNWYSEQYVEGLRQQYMGYLDKLQRAEAGLQELQSKTTTLDSRIEALRLLVEAAANNAIAFAEDEDACSRAAVVLRNLAIALRRGLERAQ